MSSTAASPSLGAIRLRDLATVVTTAALKASWRNAVRSGLRNQIVKDLHDYLDIHRTIDPLVGRLRAMVLSGNYRTSPPEVVTLEKNLGVSRRLMVPSPADAILLQAIVFALESAIVRAAPSKAAFYSRSHAGPRIEDVDDSFPYPWWLLWPEFQRRVLNFADSYEYVVTADIANYFDGIPLSRLRNAVAGLSHFEEPVLDLLFFLLEAFVWRPHYVPHSNVGLPQIDFDAPRLLAHAYLFPIDRMLEAKNPGGFVRWMDDIDFGVSREEEGKQLLRDLDDALAQLGVRLNSAKSRIMAKKQAAAHFWLSDNRALTIIQNALSNGSGSAKTISAQIAILHSSYGLFRQKERLGNWEKVMKRYLGVFGRFKDPHLEPELPELLERHAGMRHSVFRYLLSLGYSAKRRKMVTEYLSSGSCTDDSSLFEACQVLVSWRTPLGDVSSAEWVAMADHCATKRETGIVGFAAGLWLLSKYTDSTSVEAFVSRHRERWAMSEWAARQVAASFPLMSSSAQQALERVFFDLRLPEARAVVSHWREISGYSRLDKQLLTYVKHPPHEQFGYPLPKAVVARVLMEGALPTAEKDSIRQFLSTQLKDEVLLNLVLGHLPVGLTSSPTA